MAVADTDIPAPAMDWLVGSVWYCPTPNLPAPVLVNGPNGPVITTVQDQTVWHIREAAGGYLVGDCATNLGGTWSYSTIVGSLTPEGGVSLAFTGDAALMEGPDGLSVAALTIGRGTLTQVAGEPAFLMQMSSGSGLGSLTHWAYMLRAEAGDAAWEDLPGRVPRGIEEVFRLGATAGSTVPGVDATGDATAEAIAGSNRADRLDGRGGADTLTGGDGADLLLGRSGADSLSGGDGRDTLRGGEGADRLEGGAGLDVLLGGAGADQFRFAAAEATSRDRIGDFVAGVDRIALSASGLGGGLAPGALPAEAFAATLSGRATTDATRVVYETDAGRLWWDADGSGAEQRVLLAVLTGAPALAASDIVVIA